MPLRWLHETHDLIVFGRSYWPLHKWKDAPSRTLGPRHRIERHDWYNRHGLDWILEDPFPRSVLLENRRKLLAEGPDTAESFQASLAHDLIDKCWDGLTRADKKGWAEAFKGIILSPRFLRTWAGIDVFESTLEVNHSDGRVVWEFQPSLNHDWRRLKTFIESRSIDRLI